MPASNGVVMAACKSMSGWSRGFGCFDSISVAGSGAVVGVGEDWEAWARGATSTSSSGGRHMVVGQDLGPA